MSHLCPCATTKELQDELETWALNDEGLYKEARRLHRRACISMDGDSDDSEAITKALEDDRYFAKAMNEAASQFADVLKECFKDDLAAMDHLVSAVDFVAILRTVAE